MPTYHFDYELPQDGLSLPERQKATRQQRRVKGIVFSGDETGSGAYYYDLRTRHPVGARIKRLIDIVASLAAITFLAPVFLIIMALIKFTSPGAIMFRQRRIGFRCNEFEMYKFRSMRDWKPGEEANFTTAAFVKDKNDPRITPVGKILRKYSLDELPQLFNVLEGTMSLVGPRPLREVDLDLLPRRSTVRRFATPPGITGLWQVSGRSECVGVKGLEIDRKYVDRWSLKLDFDILLRTVEVVFTGKGAA
jgi:lipopolysaccharide/colanic/teichoic acid biosynthesis glycosyltransferase